MRAATLCTLCLILAAEAGCDSSGRWDFELENHSGERCSDVTLAWKGGSWFEGGSVPGGRSAVGLNGDMPKALDVSFTDGHGMHHKVHVKIPPIAPHGSEVPTVYLLIEAPDTVTAHDTDPDANRRILPNNSPFR